MCPGGEIGRRNGLKIRFPQGECGFNSHPGHQSIQSFRWSVGSGPIWLILSDCHRIVTVTTFFGVRDAGVQPPSRLVEIPFGNDVVPVEHGSCLVPADRHGNPLGNASPDQISKPVRRKSWESDCTYWLWTWIRLSITHLSSLA